LKEVEKIFEKFNSLKAFIIGDIMIDAYLWGKVDRISPEAPVPVVSVIKKENRPGGAANVALNIEALGAKAYLFSVIGNEKTADDCLDVLKEFNLDTKGILKGDNRKTTVKTRVIGNNHHLMRVDEELTDDLSNDDTDKLIAHITSSISDIKPNVIIFEDYDKGCITKTLIEAVVKIANEKNIPVTVDPKKKNFFNYKNVSLFKPNLKELREGLKDDVESVSADSISTLTKSFCERQNIKSLMVTLSEKGVYYSENGNAEILPAHIRNISDVSGAGDTVISVVSLSLAAGVNLHDAAWIANIAGGMVCEKVGVVTVEKNDLLKEIIKLNK
jgi:D-glycero-beta-D-manno-heptose-7-phosphate kinase